MDKRKQEQNEKGDIDQNLLKQEIKETRKTKQREIKSKTKTKQIARKETKLIDII